MNSNYSKDQIFGSDNMTNLIFKTNPVQVTTDLHMNIPYVTVQNASIYSSNQYYGNPEILIMTQISQPSTVNSSICPPPIERDTIVIDQPIHPIIFFYQ